MKLSDLTVEVRNKSLVRLGAIRQEDLDLELSDLHNNVGTWTLRIAPEHPLANDLRQPGAGIVVTGPGGNEIFSGPVVKPESSVTVDNPAGALVIEGVSDTVLAADYLSLPDPTNPDLDSQTKSHDVRTGKAETVMHAFVNVNLGPSAPAARRPAGSLASKVVMGANGARGATITKSARFPVLGELLADLATPDHLGFRIIQRGSNLAFETYQVVDRSNEIRLDVWSNTLAGHKVAISPPGATRVLVAGQGDLTDRQFYEMSNSASLAAETEWGRRIERFVDQRNTDDPSELQRAGEEVLEKEGFSTLAVQVVPMENSAMEFGSDWYLGDQVAVVVEGQELSSTVTGVVIKANSDGFRVGALIGEASGFDSGVALSKRLANAEKRVSLLERNAENVRVVLGNNAFAENASGDDYPLGTTMFPIVSGSGWSVNGGYGLVVTDRASPWRCAQVLHDHQATNDMWKRHWYSGTGWSGWSKIAFDGTEKFTSSRTSMTAGRWYRIATLPQGVPKGSAEFIVSTSGSGQHAYLRLAVGYAFKFANGATLHLQEYSGYASTGQPPPFIQARLVQLASTDIYDSAALELKAGPNQVGGLSMDLKVEHGEFRSGSLWTPVDFTDQGTTSDTWLTKGLYWTGAPVPLTFLNGWTNFGSGFESAAFRMLPGSVVEVQGLVKSGSGIVARLPEGCRPGAIRMFASIGGNNGVARVDVEPDGDINVAVGSNAYIALDPIRFTAMQ